MEYKSSARSVKSLTFLFCYLSLILILKYLIFAHTFIISFSILVGLPLAFDMGQNKKSGIKISNKEIIWFSGNFKGQIYPSDISSVEFKKRLDLSYIARLVDQNNNRSVLPTEVLPKISILKESLKLYPIRVVDRKFN